MRNNLTFINVYEKNSLKYESCKYKDDEGYMTLLDIVSRASKDDAVMLEMAEQGIRRHIDSQKKVLGNNLVG